MLWHLNKIINQMVIASGGEKIGEVKDIFFDEKHWTIRYFVVNSGTFLSKKMILVSPSSIVDLEPFTFQIKTNLTMSQFENAPEVDCAKPISRLEEEKYSRHFGFPFYWASTTGVWPTGSYPSQKLTGFDDDTLEKKISESNLRSYKEVIGYKIKARNEEFGNIEELIFEEESFSIRFLLINTISFWPSKSVLISPAWIKEISWPEKVFVTRLKKNAIMSSPPYDPVNPIDRIHEKELFEFYNLKPYWDNTSESEDKVDGWIPGIQKEIERNQSSDN